MKFMIGIIVAVFATLGVIDNIATVNRLKKEAAEAYENGDYKTAIAHYQTLLDSLNVEDPNIRLNLAHSLIQAGDTISAQRNYSRLVKAENKNVKSVAYQQMGVIASDQEKYKEALSIFKESLKADPSNEDARYNYELVKELLKKQEEQQQDQQNQDQEQDQQEKQKDKQKQEDQENQQQNQDQEKQQGEEGEQSEDNQEGQKQEQEKQQPGESEESPQDPQEQNAKEGDQQQEGEKSDEEQSVSPMSDRLKEMNISEEKARMILEAMRNNEMQYIQQNRRRPDKPRDRTKPDW